VSSTCYTILALLRQDRAYVGIDGCPPYAPHLSLITAQVRANRKQRAWIVLNIGVCSASARAQTRSFILLTYHGSFARRATSAEESSSVNKYLELKALR
jgi:hypothetical protein